MHPKALMIAASLTLCLAALGSFALVQAQGATPATEPAPTQPVEAEPEGEAQPIAPPRPSLAGFDMARFSETRAPQWRAAIPETVLKEQRDTRIASQRLSFAFERSDNALELSWGDERTSTPVIAVIVDEAKSDGTLEPQAYRTRLNRAAELNFTVKSIPSSFGAFSVVVEHWHVSHEGEVQIGKPFERANCPTYEPVAIAYPGLLPGVNRFRFRVKRTDANGMTSISDGVSHFVVVHEVAALGLSSSFSASAEKSSVGPVNVYEAQVSAKGEFTLSPALDAGSVKVRIARRGRRDYNATGLPPTLREMLDLPLFQQSWKTVVELPLANQDRPEATIEDLGNLRYRVTIKHALCVSDSVLPLNDAWEYLVTLHHPSYSSAVDSFTCYTGAAILGADKAEIRYGQSLEKLTSQSFTTK